MSTKNQEVKEICCPLCKSKNISDEILGPGSRS